jgi:hypothetical protein
MYCDNEDSFGLVYWYDYIEAQHKELEAKKPKTR